MGESHCRLTHESCKPSLIIMCVPCIGLVGPGGIFGLRCVGVHSSILVQQLAPLLVRPEACLDSDEWVSTPPSWSDPCPGLVGPGGISGLRQVGVHSSILVRWLASLLVRPGACLDLDEWVSSPLSRSDPCPGLVGPGGISELRQVGVHSSILVRWLAPLLVGPGACLNSDCGDVLLSDQWCAIGLNRLMEEVSS